MAAASRLGRNEPANDSLLADLRSDKGMAWVPAHMWFTFLKLDVAAGALDYDLAVSTRPGAVPSLTAAGVTASQARRIDVHAGWALWPIVAGRRGRTGDVRPRQRGRVAAGATSRVPA